LTTWHVLALSSTAVIMDESLCSSASGGPESSTSVATDSKGQTLSLLDKLRDYDHITNCQCQL